MVTPVVPSSLSKAFTMVNMKKLNVIQKRISSRTYTRNLFLFNICSTQYSTSTLLTYRCKNLSMAVTAIDYTLSTFHTIKRNVGRNPEVLPIRHTIKCLSQKKKFIYEQETFSSISMVNTISYMSTLTITVNPQNTSQSAH